VGVRKGTADVMNWPGKIVSLARRKQGIAVPQACRHSHYRAKMAKAVHEKEKEKELRGTGGTRWVCTENESKDQKWR